MLYLVTREQAEAALAHVIATIPREANIPAPALKRPDSSHFNREGLPTDFWYLVWPNGYHEPVGGVLQWLQFAPQSWLGSFFASYSAYAHPQTGHQPAMPGTAEPFVWKD